MHYWDTTRFPRLQRIVFDNTLNQKDSVELVKTEEGRVDLVTDISPLKTLRVAQSAFAKVVKGRNNLTSVFGMFNIRKEHSLWRDKRLRQAVNYAINRADLIRYAAKGNGVIIPALLPAHSFGYDSDLAPYPFDPPQARQLLRETGYPDGLAIRLIASEALAIQATVVSKMLEHVGFIVSRQLLDSSEFNRRTYISSLEQTSEHQGWDIALREGLDLYGFPVFQLYHTFALDGYSDWVDEQPELRMLYEQAIRTVDRKRQQALIRQMERHTHNQAYFLFLYNPIRLYAVNKAVQFVPYANGVLKLRETSVTEEHWSVRKQKAAVSR